MSPTYYTKEEREKLWVAREDARGAVSRAETSLGYAREDHGKAQTRFAEQITDEDRDRERPELARCADRVRSAEETLSQAKEGYDVADKNLSTFDQEARHHLMDTAAVEFGKEAGKTAAKSVLEQHYGQLPDMPEIANQVKVTSDFVWNAHVKPWAEENLTVSSSETLDRMAKDTAGSLETEQNKVLKDIENEQPTSGELEPPAFPRPVEPKKDSTPQPNEQGHSVSKFTQLAPPDEGVSSSKPGAPQPEGKGELAQPNEGIASAPQPDAGASVSKFTHVPPPSDTGAQQPAQGGQAPAQTNAAPPDETVAPAQPQNPEGPSASKFTYVPQM